MIICIWDDGEKCCYFSNKFDEYGDLIENNNYGPSFHNGGCIKTYIVNDKKHNPYGPALLNTALEYYEYWLNGYEFSKKDWEKKRIIINEWIY